MHSRRSLFPRLAAGLVALGTLAIQPAQRASDRIGGVLNYVVSEGQQEFTLIQVGGDKVGQVDRVLYSTLRNPDLYHELDRGLYSIIGDGWGLRLESAWEGFSRLIVLHS